MTTSLSGFIEFVRTDMGVTAAQVPDDSPSFTLAYGGAVFPAAGTVDGGKPEIGRYAVGRAGTGGVFLA